MVMFLFGYKYVQKTFYCVLSPGIQQRINKASLGKVNFE